MLHFFCVALFTCCTNSMLHFFPYWTIFHYHRDAFFRILIFLRVVLFSCRTLFRVADFTFFVLHYLCGDSCCTLLMSSCVDVFFWCVFSCCFLFMLQFFRVALFSCWTSFKLYYFHVSLFPYCTVFMLNFFRGALFSCCTFFRVAFFSCCTFLRVSPLYFAPLLFAFFLCNAFFLLRFVCAAIFSFFIHLLLHSLYVTLFSALTLSFDLFHVALFL